MPSIPLADCFFAGLGHQSFILLVRTRPGQMHRPERQPGGRCLALDQFAADTMHGHSVDGLVECRQKADDLMLAIPAQNM